MRKRRKRLVIWLSFHSRLKLLLSALLVALAVYVYTQELPATKTWSEWTIPLSGKTIVLDAGHGGVDGGAISKEGVSEKDINLAITLYLRDYLQQAGAVVKLTREEDKDLADVSTKGYSRRKTEDLLRRADFIKKSNAEVFLSVHLNADLSSRWKGAQTFYESNHEQNPLLAALIQDELRKNLQNTDRIAQKVNKDVYLLKSVFIPSALIEVGFLSNPEEARMLSDGKYQKKVAASIYQGLLRYYAGEKIQIN
jgi:N-acetylmuramoyl-L-alanine amidase